MVCVRRFPSAKGCFLKNSRDDEKRCQPLIFDRVPKKKDLRDDDDDDDGTLAF